MYSAYLFLKSLVYLYPNDYKLGAEVRMIFSVFNHSSCCSSFFIKLIKDYPNDYKLGSELRKFYFNYKN